MNTIEVRGLHAGYDGVPAVRGVDLDVGAGEIVALLGPNGAGKTTTLLTLAGALARMAGSATILGLDVRRNRTHELARQGVAFVPESRGIFHQLTTGENLLLAHRRPSKDRVREVLGYLPALEPLLSRRCGWLSGSEQQMLAVARALLRSPKVLIGR